MNAFVWRPLVSEPPLATLREMQDGTYSIDDLLEMHIALDEIDATRAEAHERARKGR